MKKPAFPNEVIRRKIDALYPGVSGFAAIRGGEDSHAFRFDSEDRRLIFRVNPSAEGFKKDSFVFERFASPHLPIPEIFQIGEFEDQFYCVSQEMPGRTLEELDPRDLARLVAPTCEVWHAIANSNLCGIHGYGCFDNTGKTEFSTWHSFLVGIVEASKDLEANVRSYTNVEIMKEWGDTLCLLSARCPEERALVHGDFGSNNVLADRDRITGVVDWSEGLVGDPLYDVANIFFWRTWLPCMEQQARYFEAHRPDIPRWEERIFCYQLRIGLAEVLANSLARRNEAVLWAVRRCEHIVRAIHELKQT